MERRKFLLSAGVLGCSAAASPLVTPLALADAPWDNRLVVIILRGGMDGLDVVRPVADPSFASLRPDLADLGPDLNGFFSLHPALAPLMRIYDKQEFGAVHAVSTPYRDKRSHFDGQDILEAGSTDVPGGNGDGWLNRLLKVLPGMSGETAYAIGREQLLILKGSAATARWSPEVQLRLSPHSRRLLDLVYHDDPLFREASEKAFDIVDQLRLDKAVDQEMSDIMTSNPMMSEVESNGEHLNLAKFAAARLRGSTRIASFSINGWDTHANQNAGISRSLGRLSDTILTLEAGLGAVWDQTAILCMTEFGRTARQNGTRGTDHGTAGALLYAGGALRGGQIISEWPGLTEADLYDRRDLLPTRDVRSIAGWVMRAMFGVSSDLVTSVIFPGLDLGLDPKII